MRPTPELLAALRTIARAGHGYHLLPAGVSKTQARHLSKLGWLDVREIRVDTAAGRRKEYRVRPTPAGRDVAAHAVDWRAVRSAMVRSMEGRATPEEQGLFEPALREDPARYAELHAEVKEEATARINPLHRAP